MAVRDTSRIETKAPKKSLEGPIQYEAEVIDNYVQEKRTVLYGRARVSYMDMTLKAARISVDWETHLVTAEGVLDTVWVVDEENGDSVQVEQIQGAPEFSEAGDVMRGEKMVYNFKTKRGRVIRGRTQYEDGYYSGRVMKMVRSNTMNVGDAWFTTCDQEEDPHFHFWSKKMKIVVNDKVIAKPIVMRIGRIPILALPFALFPIKRGRHSGILIPKYGESSREGRNLRGLGYYWAPSDYWDLKGTTDYFEKSGFLFQSNLRYSVRYKLQGSVYGSWTRKDFEVEGRKERRWNLNLRHNQEISPTTTLMVDGHFVSSGSFYSDVSGDRDQRLQQEIRSNFTLRKRWGGSGNITINLNQTRQLKETEYNQNLPRISEVVPQISVSNRINNLIPGPKSIGGKKPKNQWYHEVFIPYSFQYLAKKTREEDWEEKSKSQQAMGVDHNLNPYIKPKFFGWLTMTPKINYKETWLDRRKDYAYNDSTGQIEDHEEQGFFALRTFDASTALSTKIYGVFRSRYLEGVLVRHVATPNVSFTYQPDFSKERYGYYQTVKDTLGNVIARKDRFSGVLFRSTPASERKALRFSLNNLFQMKIISGEKEKKFNLFNWDISSSYNWKAKQYRLGNVSQTFRASPFRSIRFNLRMVHRFYQTDENGNSINRLYLDDVKWDNWHDLRKMQLARLVSLNWDVSLSFRGRAKTGTSSEDEGNSPDETNLPEFEQIKGVTQSDIEYDASFTGLDIPWDFSASLSYNKNQSNPLSPTKRFYANTSLNFNLTKNWKITYRAQWDLKTKKAVSQDFLFKRDLHCWEASVSYTPTGPYKRFYFIIRVKSPLLEDIKFEKTTGRRGMLGSGLGRYF